MTSYDVISNIFNKMACFPAFFREKGISKFFLVPHST